MDLHNLIARFIQLNLLFEKVHECIQIFPRNNWYARLFVSTSESSVEYENFFQETYTNQEYKKRHWFGWIHWSRFCQRRTKYHHLYSNWKQK